jgi:hypothetical protein
MSCAVKMGSDAVIYIPSFIKIDSSIEKSLGGIPTQTHISKVIS